MTTLATLASSGHPPIAILSSKPALHQWEFGRTGVFLALPAPERVGPKRGDSMTNRDFDIAVIGAGMAGSTAAAFLSTDKRVPLIEAEEVAGYHTTGRSAAIWVQNYGPPDVRALTRLSRTFYESPPAGFSDVKLIRQRSVLTLASEAQLPELEKALTTGQ